VNLPRLAVKRPVFVSCIFLLTLGLGILSYFRLTTELYPDVRFPVVNVVVPFPGAAPEEVENQISKPLENALSSLAGVRSLRSNNLQGVGIVTTVFTMATDPNRAEQGVLQALNRVRRDFPSGVQEPSIQTINPSDVPLLTLSLTAQIPESQLAGIADREIRARLQQIPQIGLVEIEGERKREIQVELDRDQLNARQMTVGEVVQRLGESGMNVPSGQVDTAERSTLVRSMGEFDSLSELSRLPVRFSGNEVLTRLSDVAQVRDGLEDERTRVYVDGQKAITLKIYRQAGGDTQTIADRVGDEVKRINTEYSAKYPGWSLAVAHDGTRPIRAGTHEALSAIEIGVILTILVVFFFLGSVRSTLITGIAIPNSLFGAFFLIWIAHFSLNITTLAALSIAVGLLIDDSIVVRENIFKRIEAGDEPTHAAIEGTREVTLAVVATTLTVLSVFGPIAFLSGIIGQFFKEFGLTICFAMLISLLDSLTMAPMLSAYFATSRAQVRSRIESLFAPVLRRFEKFQTWQEGAYVRVLEKTVAHPLTVLFVAGAIFVLSLGAFQLLPKSFVPPSGTGEFQVLLDTPSGTSLAATDALASRVDAAIRSRGEVERTLLTVGGDHGESNLAQILVLLKEDRDRSTGEMKEAVRGQLASFHGIHSVVQDILDIGGGAGAPFTVNVTGHDLGEIQKVSQRLTEALRKSGDLKDVDSSYRKGADELQVDFRPDAVEDYGISTTQVGQELRMMLAGYAPAHYHEKGEQYDVRVRLKPDQRDLVRDFGQLMVPNLNHRLVPLSAVATPKMTESPSNIRRENRKRFIEVTADVNPHGRGLTAATQLTRDWFEAHRDQIPADVGYEFAGQTRDFQDLLSSALIAIGLSIGFMYLVLASLYESFFIPLNIMLVLPLAVCGAFYALFATGMPLEINSVIGCILLMGVSAKNSILLVDRIQQGIRSSKPLKDAILDAGRNRLRPILMTTFALIAGMIPVAIPLEEAAKARSGMAVAVIGGLVSSTLLTLVVVPAAYPYLKRFESWVVAHRSGAQIRRLD